MAQPRTPRDFCGDLFPWPEIARISEGDRVVACYLVHERRLGTTRQQKPFLHLLLGDRSGSVEAKVWDRAGELASVLEPEAVVGVRGTAELFRDRLQLRVEEAEPLALADRDLELFLPASPRDRGVMERELESLIGSLEDRPLRALLARCTGADTPLGRAFRSHPAAKRNHHAYLGGLLEHSLSLAGVCQRLALHYREQGLSIDRDLLVAGALLHDIGKVGELRGTAGFAYTDRGKLLGHIVLGLKGLEREAAKVEGLSEERLLLLQHLLASHHGRLEWASPSVPQTLEALILHHADYLDSRMGEAAVAVVAAEPGGWTPYLRGQERAFFRPPEGEEERSEGSTNDTMDLFQD